jgi:hypothetical protein
MVIFPNPNIYKIVPYHFEMACSLSLPSISCYWKFGGTHWLCIESLTGVIYYGTLPKLRWKFFLAIILQCLFLFEKI